MRPLAVVATLLVLVMMMQVYWIGISWIIVSAAGIYALWQFVRQLRLWWQGRHSRVAGRERTLRVLAACMGLFLVSGTALYIAAFQHQSAAPETSFVNAEYLFRSLISSLGLFMFNLDSNVLDGIKDAPLLKGAISLQALFSGACTIALLISLAYARIVAYIKLHRRTRIDNDHNHLYVFFGMNEPSRLLARSIRRQEGERALLVFVEKNAVDEDTFDGWSSIVGLFTHRGQTFAETDELDARVTFTETRLCDIDKEKLSRTDILGQINLCKLRTLISELASGHIDDARLHFFFFSENEDENIRSLSTLALDETINRIDPSRVERHFYCHARRNGLNRVVEDLSVKRGLEVHIVDSSHLAVELLKADGRCHPVQLVETDADNPATVKTPFTALVVGFDEAGQDALRFLYEFGAFVDSTATPEAERRSPFRCIAVDPRMDELRGPFEAFAPAALSSRNADGTPLIDLQASDCRSARFYNDILRPLLPSLNCVVIAVGDDEQGMLLATRIYSSVRRERDDLSRFRIFVRTYQAGKEELMQQIADHYNEGCRTDSPRCVDDIIVPFGQKEKIYTYSTIIDDRFTQDGKRFLESYARMKGGPLWDDRHATLSGMRTRRTSEKDLRSLRRKEAQDRANAHHAATKLALLRRSRPDTFDWAGFLDRYFGSDGIKPHVTGSLSGITYPALSADENRIILNLARLEHLRWNASHELLGYTCADSTLHACDERTRRHNCLRSWHELDRESLTVSALEGWEADYKSYDFGVVDVTLQLHKDKLIHPRTQNNR